MFHNILHPVRLNELAKNWLNEDTSSYDFASAVIDQQEVNFTIYMNNPGVLAGIPFANAVFSQLGLTPVWFYSDGDKIAPSEVARISGPANKLFLAERVILNLLSRASGVATKAWIMRDLLDSYGFKGALAGTGKTTPGFRMVEKYALLVGGADMHRYNLSSLVVLKDNHVAVAGSISQAIHNTRKVCGFSLKIEVECQTLEEAVDAGNANCDIIMLHNFKPEDIMQAALNLKLQFPNILLEASFEITEKNLKSCICPWIDIISSNSLVQGYSTLDFSMKVDQ